MKNAILVDYSIMDELKKIKEQNQFIIERIKSKTDNGENLTINEAADLAKVSTQTITRWYIRGFINRYGNRGTYSYRASEIIAHKSVEN